MVVPRIAYLLTFSIPLLLIGCNSQTSAPTGMANNDGNGGQQHPPLIRSAEIVPTPLTLEGPVSVHVKTEHSGQGDTKLRYNWFVNDTLVSGNGEGQVMPELLKRGNRVHVEIVPSDGKQEGPLYRTEPVVVVNTPPLIKDVMFEPDLARAGDKVRIKVDAVDPDHEDIRFRFKWWRNERLVSEGEDSFLDTTGYVRGDTIVVSVTPRDRESQGKEFFSQPFTLPNEPPRFTTSGDSTVLEGRYEYTVKATDPDGDAISYGLETAPPGMTIDKTAGRIVWQIPTGLKGSHRVRVVAADGRGGSAFQEFDLTLTPPSAS